MHEIPDLVISPQAIDAAIFDLDGVVTRTVQVHVEAWKRLFDEFLQQHPSGEGEDLSPFDEERDYRRYLDGRPRYQGVRHFLAARRIEVPMGTAEDPAERDTVCGLGNRKNELFRQILEEGGIEVFGCAIALVHELRKVGIKTAVVSASKNCDLILKSAGIEDLFDARLDGLEAERLDLDAKPDPDTILEVVRRLGVPMKRVAIFEDAHAGVKAGKRGGFSLVVGIDRGNQRESLLKHGANVVVDDLCRIRVEGTATSDGNSSPAREILQSISDQLGEKHPVLILDYDGTLTPSATDQEAATLSETMRQALSDAASQFPVTILTGRDLSELRSLIDLPGVFYATSHGFDIAGPDLRLEHPIAADALAELDQAAELLNALVEKISGARIERKRFEIVVHYDLVSDSDVPRIEALVNEVNRSLPQLRKTGASRVFTLRPDLDWDKGHAVRWLLSALDLEGPDALPVYVGDDTADEDAFQVLHGMGIGVLLSPYPRASMATFRLDDPRQLVVFLRDLIEASKASPRA